MCWVGPVTRFQKGKFQKKLWCRVVGGRGGEGRGGLNKIIGYCVNWPP